MCSCQCTDRSGVELKCTGSISGPGSHSKERTPIAFIVSSPFVVVFIIFSLTQNPNPRPLATQLALDSAELVPLLQSAQNALHPPPPLFGELKRKSFAKGTISGPNECLLLGNAEAPRDPNRSYATQIRRRLHRLAQQRASVYQRRTTYRRPAKPF